MLKVRIETGNAAFCDPDGQGGNAIHRNNECARILRRIADDLEQYSDRDAIIMDVNGNKVGTWKMTGRK